MPRNRRIIASFITLTVLALVMCLTFMHKLEINNSVKETAKQSPGLKKIVIWNETYGSKSNDEEGLTVRHGSVKLRM